MSTNLAAPPQPTDEFAQLFARLKSLVRNHLLQFRVEVGRVILDDFFEGDLSVYGDRSHDKQKKFSAFLAANQAALEELASSRICCANVCMYKSCTAPCHLRCATNSAIRTRWRSPK